MFTSWLQIKKLLFWSVTVSYSVHQRWIISPSVWDLQWKMDFVRQLVTASSVVGPRRSSKALPKAKLAPKKGHGHCLVFCCLSDPLQLSESWWNHYIWEVCSADRWGASKTAVLQLILINRMGPILHNTRSYIAQPMLQKLNELSYKVLPHPSYSPDLSPADYHFFKHLDNFLQGKHFPNVQQIPKHGFLWYRNKQNYFLLTKMCWL